MSTKGNPRTCPKGHRYYKTSDCPACPVCESQKEPLAGFHNNLSAPARRALEANNIMTLKKLSTYTEKEILALHGIGPSAIPKLRLSLENEGLGFREDRGK